MHKEFMDLILSIELAIPGIITIPQELFDKLDRRAFGELLLNYNNGLSLKFVKRIETLLLASSNDTKGILEDGLLLKKLYREIQQED